MQGFTDGYVAFEDLKLHYVSAGSGPAVIFFHGFPLFWYAFHHQMTALQDRFRVIAVDGLGANLSSKPTEMSRYKLPQLAAQLDAVARQLIGDEPFYLVGHDWGGALAWSFAQGYPERLLKVVGINAPPTNQLLSLLETNAQQRERSGYMWRMRSGETNQRITENGGERLWQNAYASLRKLPHYSAQDDEVFRQGLAQPGAVDGAINWYRANIPEFDAIDESDYWPSRKARTAVPGLLIWGNSDTTFVDVFIDELPNYVTDLRVVRLPGIGHSPMLECPERVTELLRAFLRP